ncbi:MAG: fmt [Candidatus Saccharibacteria bacterium]|nr:fmt [Candidatus Saccharibacteria bacterium]
MNKLKKLVFFGTEDFSTPSLQALLGSGWEVAAVVTKPDRPAGRGRHTKIPAVKAVATDHGIKVLQPEKVEEVQDELKTISAEIGVLVAYGKIIPADIIDLFPAGIINVHPSLLPKYRGPSPIETAILSGDSQTGVSLMQLAPKMDAGPVYRQFTLPLSGKETKTELYARLADIGAKMLVEDLENIIGGKSQPAPQDDSKATYTTMLTKSDGKISEEESAEFIERKVRAYQGFPKTSIKLMDKYEVVVTKARVASSSEDGDLVIKAKGGFIVIEELIAPSGRLVSGAEFLRGYRA